MLVVMGVTLFTSRIVLQALGVEDFGLYNVVGGVVGLFTFLRTSMEKCTQRFLNVEMAKKNGRLNEIFCMSMYYDNDLCATISRNGWFVVFKLCNKYTRWP